MVMEKVTTEEQEQKKKKLLRIYLLEFWETSGVKQKVCMGHIILIGSIFKT